MTKKICVVVLFFFVSTFCATAQEPSKASAELTNETPHYHGGDNVAFKLTLNEPLPLGSRIDVRFSPANVGQEFPASCEQPKDKDRKELLCNLKLSDNARGGEWRIAEVYFFLENVAWTHSTIATELKFRVDGTEGPLPTAATAEIIKK